jgi:hypothetical protein
MAYMLLLMALMLLNNLWWCVTIMLDVSRNINRNNSMKIFNLRRD